MKILKVTKNEDFTFSLENTIGWGGMEGATLLGLNLLSWPKMLKGSYFLVFIKKKKKDSESQRATMNR